MQHRSPLTCWPLCWLAFLGLLPPLSASAQPAEGGYRTWRDVSGQFQLDAVLLSHSETHVRLRKRDEREVEVPIEKLSKTDREFIAQAASKPQDASRLLNDGEVSVTRLPSSRRGKDSPNADLDNQPRNSENIDNVKAIATAFFKDLRTDERREAAAHLTDAARALIDSKKSAFPLLPAPDSGSRAIRVGKPIIKSDTASVAVTVSVAGSPQRTLVQLRKHDDTWQIHGISAWRDDKEVTIDFEKPMESNPPKSDPASEWKGQNLSISGLTLDGRKVSLDQFRGKVVLIDFWATWCGPCIKEMPNVLENYVKYHDAGFEVLAISLDDDMMDLQNFVTKENPPWVVLADNHPQNTESMARKLGIRAIPTLLLIGPDGTVIDVNCRGPRLGAKLAEVFRR